MQSVDTGSAGNDSMISTGSDSGSGSGSGSGTGWEEGAAGGVVSESIVARLFPKEGMTRWSLIGKSTVKEVSLGAVSVV